MAQTTQKNTKPKPAMTPRPRKQSRPIKQVREDRQTKSEKKAKAPAVQKAERAGRAVKDLGESVFCNFLNLMTLADNARFPDFIGSGTLSFYIIQTKFTKVTFYV